MLLQEKGKKIVPLMIGIALALPSCHPSKEQRFRRSSEIVDFLENGGDPNHSFNYHFGNPKSRLTLLHWAVKRRDLMLVNRLIASGADPNSRDYNGQTPLMLAFSNANGPENIRPIIIQLARVSDLTVTDLMNENVFDKIDLYADKKWKAILVEAAE